MLASQRSVGRRITFEDRDYVVEQRTMDSFNGVDIALFSAGRSISKKFGPVAVDRGTMVVDNSSAFRMDEKVPLVIPEVNPEAMQHIKAGTGKGTLIANPNCSTIICLMGATLLHRRAKAASGAGAAAMEELELQTREVWIKLCLCSLLAWFELYLPLRLCEEESGFILELLPDGVVVLQYAFNLFSHNASVLSNGYNEEIEMTEKQK
ncbi:hypothetical protein LR48_Vigan02g129000 [Vigna angularis]|uniref:Semialdehyde dehydrogenase NAD-binding domain-containing protein n=1 Tax=Phaseolus angularis TaxID=3914 RepID=A0A0L9TX72_PHAAN|nr:uncharacterized protein HKW66_Vig0238950 [Vigna angularis]KOM35140.1 hypothetical protein LR48_Vigan02g129000 [Vigna angularis]